MNPSYLTAFNVTIRPIEVPPMLGMTITQLAIPLGTLAMIIILRPHLRENLGDHLLQETIETIPKPLLAHAIMMITDVELLLIESDTVRRRNRIIVVGMVLQLNLLTEVTGRLHPRPLLHHTMTVMIDDPVRGTLHMRLLLVGAPERLLGRVTTMSERDILQGILLRFLFVQ